MPALVNHKHHIHDHSYLSYKVTPKCAADGFKCVKSVEAPLAPDPLAAAPLTASLPPLACCCPSGRAVLRTQLDPVSLVVDIEDALLDLVVDLPGSVDEGLLHVGRSLSGSLHEDQSMFPGKGLALLSLDVAASLQITEEVGAGMNILQQNTQNKDP